MGNTQSQGQASHRDQEINRISQENEKNWGVWERTYCLGSQMQRDLTNNMLPENKGCVSEPNVISSSICAGEVTCTRIVDIPSASSSHNQAGNNSGSNLKPGGP